MVLQQLEGVGEEAFDHAVVDIRRVSRTMKGGRRFRFRAAVIVGDKKGQVGFGLGKGRDVPTALGKAQASGKRALMSVPRRGGTIPHAVEASFRGAHVLLKPAPAGAGIIAGGSSRAVATLAGIRDISCKSLGSRNVVNVARATLKALSLLKTVEDERAASSVQRAETAS